MQSELGAPIGCVRRSPVGVGPLTGRDVGSGGTSIENMRLKLPSVSKTWMRWFVRSPTYTLSWRSIAIEWGMLNSPGPLPLVPHDFTQSPFLSYLATRELT